MASIVIKDLTENCLLDADAMAAVAGGINTGFIRAYNKSGGAGSIVNQFITLYQAEELYLINQTIENTIINSDNIDLEVDVNGLLEVGK